MKEVEEHDVMPTAPKSSKDYEVSRIVGEQGRSRSSKHYLVEYKGYDQAWWQPVGNLYCDKKVQEWNMLYDAKRNELTEAAEVANPDLIALVMDLRMEKQAGARKLILEVCEQAGVSRSRLRAVLGSTPCNSFTKLDAVNVGRGNNFREPYMPFPPRKFDGSEQSRILGQIAQEHDEMIHNLLLSVVQDRQEGFTYDFCFENPRGVLRHMPYMKGDAWLEISNRCTPDYCAFKHEFQKPTDLWHSFGQSWQPEGTTGDGKCHQKCGAGRRKASGRYAHYKRHAGALGTGVTGKDQMLQKWRIPDMLCEEVVAKLTPVEGQDVVIDLFSGGESYRRAVEAAGFTYIAVDVLTMEVRGHRNKAKEAGNTRKN